MKRLMDIVLSATALTFLSPVFAVIMIILKFTGEHEVFYLQQRVGLNGNVFNLIKFATMLKDSPNMPDGVLTRRNDPRILPFGKFLRKTKINELPQLINVFIGDMSVVGPRPQAIKHFEVFPQHVKNEIINVKPGLTGIGSVIFRDEETIMSRSSKGYARCYQEDIAPYKGELELWYIRNYSLKLDILLIGITAWVILFPESSVYTAFFKELPRKPAELNGIFKN